MGHDGRLGAAPRISVITVVLNGADHLEQCIESIRIQVGAQHEHIVIDGGSCDGSLEIIRRHADALSSWVSEPDRGISDAMNKGISRARGEWLLFLHSDDFLLAQDSLRICVDRLTSSRADIVGFPIQYGMPGRFRIRRPYRFGFWLNLKALPHQGCFTRRSLFDRLGGFDRKFRIDMDYEFLLRALRAGAVIETLDRPLVSFMRSTGLSSNQDWKSLSRRFGEEREIHFRHANRITLKWFYGVYWPVYLAYRWIRWRMFGSVKDRIEEN